MATQVEALCQVVASLQTKKAESLEKIPSIDHVIERLRSEIEASKLRVRPMAGQQQPEMPAEKRMKLDNTDNKLPEKENNASQKGTRMDIDSSLSRSALELRLSTKKVHQLRHELKVRGLVSQGRKKDLIQRLLDDALGEEMEESEPSNYFQEMKKRVLSPVKVRSPKKIVMVPKIQSQAPSSVPNHVKSPVLRSEPAKADAEMKNVPLTVFATETEGHGDQRSHVCSTEREEVMQEDVEKETCAVEGIVDTNGEDQCEKAGSALLENEQEQKSPGKSANSVVSSSTFSTPSDVPDVKGIVKNAFKVFSKEDASICTSDAMSQISSSIDPSMRVSGTKVRELISKMSATKPSSSTSSSTSTSSMSKESALSESVKAKNAQRLARVEEQRRIQRNAEIRGKSKPAAMVSAAPAPKEYSSTLSSLKATAMSTSTIKKKNLATQMREKREKEATVSAKPMASAPSTLCVPSLSKPAVVNDISAVASDSQVSGAAVEKTKGMKVEELPIQSPMETYDMSDREDSDTDDDCDSEEEHERKKGKKIPTWAERPNLVRALERQYDSNMQSGRVDPDDIFPEVKTCDLEAIFGTKNKKTKYSRRTSSGNWTNDRVTVAEKLVYKRTMGFANGSKTKDSR